MVVTSGLFRNPLFHACLEFSTFFFTTDLRKGEGFPNSQRPSRYAPVNSFSLKATIFQKLLLKNTLILKKVLLMNF